MKVALIGFGNVGQEFAEIWNNRWQFPGLSSLDLRVVALSTATRGSLVCGEGIDLGRALAEIRARSRFSLGNPALSDSTAEEIAESVDFDVLIELSPLNIEQRGEPALSYLRSALRRGRHVVTANKGPIAFSFPELAALAAEHSSMLLYESTVMDGAPVFNMARTALQGCRVQAVRGILNSTSNFVLSEMERGATADSAVRLAQQRGFAEADPTLDLDGWDGAVKISVLANVLMDFPLSPLEVNRETISELEEILPATVFARKKRLKSVCSAWRSEGGVQAEVKLEEIPLGHPFATVSGPGAILEISTDLMSPILIAQHQPTPRDTAYGVLNDLLEIKAANGV